MVTNMKNFLCILSALLITVLAGCASPPPATTAPEGLTQSGTWVVREDQVMALAAGHAGQGTLIFEGWQYPFEFSGARIGVSGTDTGDIKGEVYNLERVEDIEGTYFPKAEFDAANRVTGAWAHNDKGVKLHLRLQGENMEINLQAQGATIKLIEQ
jgi:hypothetical protein